MENANQSVEDGREGDAEGAVEDGEGGREVLEGGGGFCCFTGRECLAIKQITRRGG